ncbi:hypothetical protein MRB53_037688 [Persea americana]|nr:hypothetical protein MRB53_037688 [Persea americana]
MTSSGFYLDWHLTDYTKTSFLHAWMMRSVYSMPGVIVGLMIIALSSYFDTRSSSTRKEYEDEMRKELTKDNKSMNLQLVRSVLPLPSASGTPAYMHVEEGSLVTFRLPFAMTAHHDADRTLKMQHSVLPIKIHCPQLTGWGLSAGDVIALAGAGRGIITWLTSDARDNGLLEFLKVTQQDLRLRKGLLDPVALNERWSQHIRIFHNGRPEDHYAYQPSDQLENVCRFTWMMTLIVAALDASMSNSLLQTVIVDFSTQLFIDAVLATDYLQHEIPEHINGWRSAATTRSITFSARIIWENLEKQESHHLPGFIPANEHHEIVRFLLWLTKGDEMTMTTNSSDVHSLARTLSEIGFDLLRTSISDTVLPPGQLQGGCLLIYSDAWTADRSDPAMIARPGMRIPLATLSSMAEVISLWPEPQDQHDDLRLLFTQGQDAASHLNFTACQHYADHNDERDILLQVSSDVPGDICYLQWDHNRPDSNLWRVLSQTTLQPYCPHVRRRLEPIMSTWSAESVEDITAFLLKHASLSKAAPIFFSRHPVMIRQRDRAWEQLRSFLLGYYYGAFAKMMDTSKLRIREGFGSWSWDDRRFFEVIASFASCKESHRDKQDVKQQHKVFYWRHNVLKVAAYLFAGAEPDQLQDDFRGVAGVAAKLIILTPGLLGEADTPFKIAKFHLLDIDPTSIPCNQRGWIRPAPQDYGTYKTRTIDSPSRIESFAAISTEPDFTAHIEPAWKYDKTFCHVVYRHQGRIIYRTDALHAEATVLNWWAGDGDGTDLESYKSSIEAADFLLTSSRHSSTVIVLARVPSDFLEVFDEGIPELLHDEASKHAVIVATGKKPRARICLAAMLGNLFQTTTSARVRSPPWRANWSAISNAAIVVETDAYFYAIDYALGSASVLISSDFILHQTIDSVSSKLEDAKTSDENASEASDSENEFVDQLAKVTARIVLVGDNLVVIVSTRCLQPIHLTFASIIHDSICIPEQSIVSISCKDEHDRDNTTSSLDKSQVSHDQ